MIFLMNLALVAVTATSTPALSREQKYRSAAIINASAADKAIANLEACTIELEAERRILPLAASPIDAPTPVILYGIAGLGLGLAIGVVATLAAMGGSAP